MTKFTKALLFSAAAAGAAALVLNQLDLDAAPAAPRSSWLRTRAAAPGLAAGTTEAVVRLVTAVG